MLFLLMAPTSFMAGPALTSVRKTAVPMAAGPQMMLGMGGAGRALGRMGRATRSIMKVPGSGNKDSGSGFGCGNDGGGTSGDATPAGEDGGDNPFVMAWKTYNSKLETDPLIMKMLTSFTGFLLGDIIAQTLITKGDFDFFRLFRLSSFGFLIHGSTSHYFYGFLDGKIPGTSATSVASKVFIDQVLWNPIFGIMFFSYVAALESKGLQYVIDKTKNELMTQVYGSWKVWPIAHTINFRFIPSSQRVLYINSIQIGYNCFLSIIANK